jgi:hypothetical protein
VTRTYTTQQIEERRTEVASTLTVIPELVVDATSPEFENINDDPVPLATLTTLIEEEVPLAVMTGDDFDMVLWSILLGGSVFVIMFVFVKMLRENKRKK